MFQNNKQQQPPLIPFKTAVMFDALITQIDASLDELVSMVDTYASTHSMISPVLLSQPPGTRQHRRDSLRSRENALADVLTRVASLEAKLTRVRTSVFEQQCSHASAQTPISALPIEILQYIFSFAVHDAPKVVKERTGAFAATTLSQVCHKWRVIITNQPKLWATLTLLLGDLPHADAFLRRSTNASLNVRVVNVCAPSYANDTISREFTQRLETLTVVANDELEDTLNGVFWNKNSYLTFHSLRDLSISSIRQPTIRISHAKFPALETLTLFHTMVGQIDAPQLTTLILGSIICESFFPTLTGVLRGCPRLRMLVISGVKDLDVELDIPIPVVMRDLRSLIVRHAVRKTLNELLKYIKAPSLETFAVNGGETAYISPAIVGEYEPIERSFDGAVITATPGDVPECFYTQLVGEDNDFVTGLILLISFPPYFYSGF